MFETIAASHFLTGGTNLFDSGLCYKEPRRTARAANAKIKGGKRLDVWRIPSGYLDNPCFMQSRLKHKKLDPISFWGQLLCNFSVDMKYIAAGSWNVKSLAGRVLFSLTDNSVGFQSGLPTQAKLYLHNRLRIINPIVHLKGSIRQLNKNVSDYSSENW